MVATVERLPHRHSQEKVAVLLNANAKAVTERLRRELEQFVPPEDIYYSRSFEDARAISRMVLDRGYRTVLTGGGDGTFVGYLNCMLEAASPGPGGLTQSSGGAALRLVPRAIPLPRFGVLKLGTGNSLANLSNSSSRRLGVLEDVLRARSGAIASTRKLHLLTHEGKRAPFAGMGIDAAVLNDYMRVKGSLSEKNLRFAGIGGLGYFWAVVGRTIPSVLAQRTAPTVEVVNLGAPAQQVGPDGRPLGRIIDTGEILYRGPCRLAAAGTVPCYGYKLQIFPFAERNPGRFQLRLTAMGVPWILSHLPQIWRGQTPKSGMIDFTCEKVSIRFDREMPLQVGGDAEGYRREVTLAMAPETMELIDFSGAKA
jgi:diacylglycerol kinase family enzyme